MPSSKKSYRRPYSPPFAAPAPARQPSLAPTPTAPKPKPPLEVAGDPHLWQTLQQVKDPASGWTKTTRAMQVPGGVLINTCSRKIGSTVAAEALCLCPNTRLVREPDGVWRLQ